MLERLRLNSFGEPFQLQWRQRNRALKDLGSIQFRLIQGWWIKNCGKTRNGFCFPGSARSRILWIGTGRSVGGSLRYGRSACRRGKGAKTRTLNATTRVSAGSRLPSSPRPFTLFALHRILTFFRCCARRSLWAQHKDERIQRRSGRSAAARETAKTYMFLSPAKTTVFGREFLSWGFVCKRPIEQFAANVFFEPKMSDAVPQNLGSHVLTVKLTNPVFRSADCE